jgi:hypothetical protein
MNNAAVAIRTRPRCSAPPTRGLINFDNGTTIIKETIIAAELGLVVLGLSPLSTDN